MKSPHPIDAGSAAVSVTEKAKARVKALGKELVGEFGFEKKQKAGDRRQKAKKP